MTHLISGRFLPVMVLHLGVDESRNVALVAAKHLARVFLGKIAFEMLHRLRGQIIEQIGMIVVRNIIEIHQAAHHVILQPRFLNAAAAQASTSN